MQAHARRWRLKTRPLARAWALSALPKDAVEVGTDHVPSQRVQFFGVPFYVISHAWHVWRAAFLAEPGQTPHITTWVYGCRRLFRCGCAGAVRREGYGGSAWAVVLGHGRGAPLKTAVVCSSSPQHWSQGDETSGMRMFANGKTSIHYPRTENHTVTREQFLGARAEGPVSPRSFPDVNESNSS